MDGDDSDAGDEDEDEDKGIRLSVFASLGVLLSQSAIRMSWSRFKRVWIVGCDRCSWCFSMATSDSSPATSSLTMRNLASSCSALSIAFRNTASFLSLYVR